MLKKIQRSRCIPVYLLLILSVIVCFCYKYGLINNTRMPTDMTVEQVNTYYERLEEIKDIKRRLNEYERKLEYSERKLGHSERKQEYIEDGKNKSDQDLPTIYLITPTYTRLQQKAELVRLSQTLMHIKKLHWIVVEDSENKTDLVRNLLKTSGIQYTHLNVTTPSAFQLKENERRYRKPRGALQRNVGLAWIRETLNPTKDKGVVYFADDDNTYSLELFNEIRKTKKVSVWPVGLVGGILYESPVINNNTVVEWHSAVRRRTFALDMAGFAVNMKLFFEHPEAEFRNYIPPISQEDQIFKGLKLNLTDLEPRAEGCTKILVWHTRTENPSLINEKKLTEQYGGPSNRWTGGHIEPYKLD